MLAIERAAAAIRRGEVVAIPTDALYTLVADPLNLHAVGRVFAAKGREIYRDELAQLRAGSGHATETTAAIRSPRARQATGP